MQTVNLKEKIDNLYNESKQLDGQGKQDKVQVKNIDVLISHMIKHHYEWEEIVTIIGILRKGGGQELVNIIKDTII